MSVEPLREYSFSMAEYNPQKSNHILRVIYRHMPLPNRKFFSTEMCCTSKYGTRLERDLMNLLCFSNVLNPTDICNKPQPTWSGYFPRSCWCYWQMKNFVCWNISDCLLGFLLQKTWLLLFYIFSSLYNNVLTTCVISELGDWLYSGDSFLFVLTLRAGKWQ